MLPSQQTQPAHPRVFLYTTLTLDFENMLALFEHFINHYIQLGIQRDRVLLTVHSLDLGYSQLQKQALDVVDKHGLNKSHLNLWNGKYSAKGLHRWKMHATRFLYLSDWLLDADTDEFVLFARPRYGVPNTLWHRRSGRASHHVATWCLWAKQFDVFTHGNGSDSRRGCNEQIFQAQSVDEKVLEAEANGMNGVITSFRDRVRLDGSLVTLRGVQEERSSIFDTFPLECQAVKKIIKGSDQKVVLHRMNLVTHIGHHCIRKPNEAYMMLKRQGLVRRNKTVHNDTIEGWFATGWKTITASAFFKPRLEELNGCWGGSHHFKFTESLIASAKRREFERRGKPAHMDSKRTLDNIVRFHRVHLNRAGCFVSHATSRFVAGK